MRPRHALSALGLSVALALGAAAPALADGSPVAGGAAHLEVRVDRGPGTAGPVTSIDVTDRALVERIIDGVDALPTPPPGVFHCPVDLGARVVLAFFRDTDPRPYAVVVADPQGCGDVAVITHDAGRRSVERLSGGASFAAAVLATLGLAPLAG